MRSTYRSKTRFRLFIAFAIIMTILILAIYPTTYILSQEDVTITIVKTERITKGDDSYYLIYTKDETFKEEDDLLFLKFNSSDIYGKLLVGETYNVSVAGFRIPFLSSYRNIVGINKVEIIE